jgi:hypothetical protein
MRQTRVCGYLPVHCDHCDVPPSSISSPSPTPSDVSSWLDDPSSSPERHYSPTPSDDALLPFVFDEKYSSVDRPAVVCQELTCSYRSALLQLPALIRSRIYRLAGIITGHDISLNPVRRDDYFPPPNTRPRSPSREQGGTAGFR